MLSLSIYDTFVIESKFDKKLAYLYQATNFYSLYSKEEGIRVIAA